MGTPNESTAQLVDNSLYRYEPLRYPENVRLIRILEPRAMDDGIPNIEILETSFSDAPGYNCLSYCWGINNRTAPIICRGKNLFITESLSNCLISIAHGISPLFQTTQYWWIDQICINQTDEDEKSTQVLWMTEIYTRSRFTIAWVLSLQDHIDDGLIRILTIAHEAYRDLSGFVPPKHDPSPMSWLATMGFPPLDDEAWGSFAKLLQSPWFTRMWVIQEIVFSGSRLWLYIGGLVVSRDVFHWLFDIFGNRAANLVPLELREFGSYGSAALIQRRMESTRASAGSTSLPQRWSLSGLITITTTSESSDPRDKIFALASFVPIDTTRRDNLYLCAIPNYAKTKWAVFRDATRYCVEESKTLYVLSAGGNPGGSDDICRSAHDNVPSWSMRPDISAQDPLHTVSPGRRLIHHNKIRYDLELFKEFPIQSWSATKHHEAEIGSHADDNVLSLKGVIIDKVRNCTRSFATMEFASGPEYPLLTLWKACHEWFGVDLVTSSDQEAEQLITRLLAVYNPWTSDTSMNDLRKNDPVDSNLVTTTWFLLRVLYQDSPETVSLPQEAIARIMRHGYGPPESIKLVAPYPTAKYFVLGGGQLGCGPDAMREGDVVAALLGGQALHILRPCGDEFHLVGECFVREFSEGQAVTDWEEGRRKAEWINLR